MIDVWHNYYCEECGCRESSNVGSPLLYSEDDRAMCESCYDKRELVCSGCEGRFRHDKLHIVEHNTRISRYCDECIKDDE